MAFVEKRPGGWIGRYRVDGQKHNTSVRRRKVDALTEARKLEDLARQGEWVDPKAGAVTLSAWSERWLASLDVAPKTQAGYEELLSSLILPRWGKTPLRQIEHSAVKEWARTMKGLRTKTLSASRRSAASKQLSRMLDAAVDEGLISRNPAKTKAGRLNYLPTPKTAKAHRYLSHAELDALASAAGEWGTLIRFTGLTGLRWGEVTALRVGDFNMLGRSVTVERAYSIVKGHPVLGDTKTHERRRVAFPRSLSDDLAADMAGKGPLSLSGQPAQARP